MLFSAHLGNVNRGEQLSNEPRYNLSFPQPVENGASSLVLLTSSQLPIVSLSTFSYPYFSFSYFYGFRLDSGG